MSNNISNDFFNPFDTTSEQISQNQVSTSDAGDTNFIVSEGFARAADSVSTISATKNLDKIQIVGKDGIQVSLSSASSTTAKFTISAPSFALGQAQLASGLTVNTGTTGRIAYYSTASSIGASSQNLTYDVNTGALSYDTANILSLINIQDSNSSKGLRFNFTSGNPSMIYSHSGSLVLESQNSNKISIGAAASDGIFFSNSFLKSQYGIEIENPSTWSTVNSKPIGLKISAPAQSMPLAIGSSDFFVDIGSSLGDVKVGIGTNTPTHELQVIGNVSASVYYGDGSNLTGITTAPAGNNTQVQFNNAGAFGASSDFVWNDTSKQLTVNGDISASIFYGDGSSLTNLPAPGIQNIVEDTAPQLGGNLDMNGNIVASSFEVSGAFDLHGPTTPGQESNPTWRPRVYSTNGALILQGGQNTSANITIGGGNIYNNGNFLAYGVNNQVRLQDGNSNGRFRVFEANSGRERMEMHAFNKYTNFYVHQASPYVFRIVDGSSSSDVGNDYLTISGSDQSMRLSGSTIQVTGSLHVTDGTNVRLQIPASSNATHNSHYADQHNFYSKNGALSSAYFGNSQSYVAAGGASYLHLRNDFVKILATQSQASGPKVPLRLDASIVEITGSMIMSGSSHTIKGDLTLVDPTTAGRSRLYFQSGGSVTPYIGTQTNQIEINAGSYGITLKNNTTNTMRILSNRVGIALGAEPQKALEVGGEVRFGASTANIHQITGSVDATGNLTASGHVSASAFYGDGSALTNLPPGGISNVVEDTTPQLGGNLDVNGNFITGTTVVLTASSVSSDAISLRGNTEAYEDTRIRKDLTVGFVGNGNAIINLARGSNGATVGQIVQTNDITYYDNLQGAGTKFRVAGASLFEMMHIKSTGVDIGRIGTDVSTVTGALHLDSSATNKLGGADIVNGSRVYLPRGNAILDVGNPSHSVTITGAGVINSLRNDYGQDAYFEIKGRSDTNPAFKVNSYANGTTPPLIEMSASTTQVTGDLEVTGNILVPLSQNGIIGFKDSAGTWNNPTFRGMRTSGTNGTLYIDSSYGNGGPLVLNNSHFYNYRSVGHTARQRYESPGNGYGGNSGNSYHSYWTTSGLNTYSLYIHDGGQVAVGVEKSSTTGNPYFHIALDDDFTVFGTSHITGSSYASDDLSIKSESPGIALIDKVGTTKNNFKISNDNGIMQVSIDTDDDLAKSFGGPHYDDILSALSIRAGTNGYGKININANSVDTALYVKDVTGSATISDPSSYVAHFINDAGVENAGGIQITAGPSTGPIKPVNHLAAYDGGGTYVGGLRYETSGFSVYSVSDESLKDNITTAQVDCLSKIKNINLYSYDWKKGGHTEVGFIAQDLEKEFPNMVTDDEIKAISEQKLIPILTKAIQEQQEMIDKLIKRVEELENK